ncbi:NUDIX domain-containing protein [Candidatus Woesearchaeota archaeon]|nr:NUDIX domain-containing protein [Candidatus Woesearchaeota archaeon]
MNGSKILNLLKEFSERLPKFKDGRIDYSNSDKAPVVTIFVKFGDKILLLKRSDKVATYKGKWNTIAGYLDEIKSIKDKILEELREEIGVNEKNIKFIEIKNSYKLVDNKINKTWIVHPVLVELKEKPEIKLDWEHTEFRWINYRDLKNYDIVTDLDKTLDIVLKT